MAWIDIIQYNVQRSALLEFYLLFENHFIGNKSKFLLIWLRRMV